MNLLSCVDEGKCRTKLEIEIDAESFSKAVEAAYRKKAPKLSVPGFRKGKAPRGIIERMYGKAFFYEEAVNDIYPEALDEAIKEKGLHVLDDRIDLEVTKVGEEGMIFTATVTVAPEITISDYKGIVASKHVHEVTDEMVDHEIEHIRQRNARTITIEDRPAKEGDTAVIDYEGFEGGVAFEGGKGENHSLELGSNSFIPGFEEQIIGHSVGEEFDINVTFPEEYHAENLAGKPAVFKIKLHEIKETQVPDLDDDFVKDVSEFDTVDEYKASVKADLEKNAADAADHEVDNQLYDKIADLVEGDVPEVMYKNYVDQRINEFDNSLKAQGMSIKDYFKYTGMSEEDFREQMLPEAEKNVKLRLGLQKIAELENIEATDEDIDAEINKLAEQYKMEAEQIKKIVDRDMLSSDIKVDKAMALVRDNAEITTEE